MRDGGGRDTLKQGMMHKLGIIIIILASSVQALNFHQLVALTDACNNTLQELYSFPHDQALEQKYSIPLHIIIQLQ